MNEESLGVNGDSLWPAGYVLRDRYVIDRVMMRRPLLVSYLAFDLARSKPVVLQVLDETLVREPALMPRLREEASRAQHLAHDHVAAFHGLDEDGPHVFAVRDYVDGLVLEEYLAQAHRLLTFYEALQVIDQTGRALHQAHSAGILHRALNLQSIVLSCDGRVVVRGLALPSLVGLSGESDFDPHYLSPEQCLGQKIDHRADLYSLATIAYRLYVGRPPFLSKDTSGDAARGWKQICWQHVHSPPPFASTVNRDVPKEIGWVLSKGLAKRPNERFRSAAEFTAVMKRAWREAGLDPEAMCAEPPSWITEPRSFAPPKPLRVRPTALGAGRQPAPPAKARSPQEKVSLFWLGGLALVVLAIWAVLLAILLDNNAREQASMVFGQRPPAAEVGDSAFYEMPTWTPPIIPTPTGTRVSLGVNVAEFAAPPATVPAGVPFNGLRPLSGEFNWAGYVSSVKWRAYTEPRFGYALVYPDGWELEPGQNVLRLYMPERDVGVAICACGTRVADASQWAARVLDMLRNDFPGLQQLEQRVYQPGWLATAARAPQEGDDEIQIAILSSGQAQRGYAVVFVAWASDWQGAKPIFDQMAQNARFP